jgi:hypothetical protein
MGEYVVMFGDDRDSFLGKVIRGYGRSADMGTGLYAFLP